MTNITPRMSAAEYQAMARSGAPASRRAGRAPRAGRVSEDLTQGATRKKYGNQCVVDADGTRYDSVKEARHMQALDLARKADEDHERVVAVRRQVPFELVAKQPGERAVKYVADFVVAFADGRIEVQDIKSPPTRANRAYVIKRKLMLAVHGISICEL